MFYHVFDKLFSMAFLTSACTHLTTANHAMPPDQQPQTLGTACQRALDHGHELIRLQRVVEAEHDLLTAAKESCSSGYEADQLLRYWPTRFLTSKNTLRQ